MTPKIAYALILYTLLQNALGGNRIDIYLSLHDCLNHYSALSSLSSLTDFEKNIVIRREDSLVMQEVLKEYALSDVNYRYVKSPPFSMAYYKVFLNDQLADSLPLSLLPEKVKRYAYAAKFKNKVCEIPLSDTASIRHKQSFPKGYKVLKGLNVCDVFQQVNLWKLLVLTSGNELEVLDYDPKQQKIVSKITRKLPADCSLPSLRLYDGHTLFFLSSTQAKGYLFELN